MKPSKKYSVLTIPTRIAFAVAPALIAALSSVSFVNPSRSSGIALAADAPAAEAASPAAAGSGGTAMPGASAGASSPTPAAAPADIVPPSTQPANNPTWLQAQAIIDKAFAWFKKTQKPDNGWQGPHEPPAVTALVLRAFLLDERYNADMNFLDRGYDRLIAQQKAEGGIYTDALANYNTAIAVSALAVAKEPEYAEPLDKALKYLRTLQWNDTIEGVTHVTPDNLKYGGTGYGKQGRPDLSNLQMTLDALHDAGVAPGDPAFAAAIKFVTRCQNNSETNDQKVAGDDGGFFYTPANGGESPAGEYTGADGRRMVRSYGSMTYAGLKSMIYAGLSKDDGRVKAAWAWIGKNYTVDINPGMEYADPSNPDSGKSGLFYYLLTMARALHAYGEPTIVDANGKSHDWRVDITNKLQSLQHDDGTFVNDKDKWMEGSPTICTAYAATALEIVKQDLTGQK